MKPKTKAEKIEQALTRGVEKILPSKTGLARLMKKRRIRLYLGIDPTSPKLHLGHTIPLRKLKHFQDLGHEVILLFGTFTAQIGDPSGRDEARKPLSPSQIKKNMADYKRQAAKILDFSKVKIKQNADWLAKFNFAKVLEVSSRITISRLLERDMFQKRLKQGKEVWPHEVLYPLMQGYDSVAMDVDLEVGGSDQLFNMFIGRKLQRIYNKKEKFILTTPLLRGLDGRKMSKTHGNTVNLDDAPNEMYGKIMSLKDELIIEYFELCTDLPSAKIKNLKKSTGVEKVKPRDLKAGLAREIVAMYHSRAAAQRAEKEFNKVFREKGLPSVLPQVSVRAKEINILDLLIKTKLVPSKAGAKRLILQKGIKIDGKVQQDWQKKIKIKKGMVIQKGKRKFAQVK